MLAPLKYNLSTLDSKGVECGQCVIFRHSTPSELGTRSLFYSVDFIYGYSYSSPSDLLVYQINC
jgi:hypothetical protein